MDSARTDGNHATIPAATALSQRFRCRSCSGITEAGDIRIADRQYGRGTNLLRLADSGYDPVGEDFLLCSHCDSNDLQIIA